MRVFLVMLSILVGSSLCSFADVSEYDRFINPYQVNISLPSKELDEDKGVELRSVSPYERYDEDKVERLENFGKDTIYNIKNTEIDYGN